MKRRIFLLVSVLIIVAVLITVAVWVSSSASSSPETQTGQDQEDMGAGPADGEYHEAPVLAELVAAGELPPVDQRLPPEPVVVEPLHETGQYGGTMSIQISNPAGWEPGVAMMVEPIFGYDYRTGDEIIPVLATGYDLSADGLVFTLYLREGVKWSDGEPFTSADFTFFWNDVMMDKDLTPALPGFLSIQMPETVVALDEHTVQFTFDSPYYIAPRMFSQFGNYGCVGTSHLPRHIYEKWHIKYNENAQEMAIEEGHEHWWQLFNSKRVIGILDPQIPGIPSLGPWVIEKSTANGAVWRRNPYYLKVDTAGNQLPYIDEVVGIYMNDPESNLLRTMNGEYDYATFQLGINDYPILQDNADSGNYNVRIAEGENVSDVAFRVNWQHVGDEEVAAILADKRFRQALSLGINREEVNEFVSLGFGIPMQFTIKKTSAAYKPEWGDAYADFNPDAAMALLDEMGMSDFDSDGFRLTPGGKPFTLDLGIMSISIATVDASELIRDYWEAIGIRVNLQIREITAVVETLRNKTFMVFGQELPSSSDLAMIIDGIETWNSWAVFNDWWAWRQYDGEQGTEPSEDVKRIFEIQDARRSVPMEETLRQLEWVFDWVAEYLPVIGVMGYTGSPVVWSKDLGNVDTSLPASGTYMSVRGHRPEIFYWKK